MSNLLVELSNAMAAAVEKAGLSTVMVNARRRMPASGIAYTAELILTANHVVERDEGISVTLSDGNEIPATVVGRDHGTDLALLRLERPLASPAETAQDAKVGQLALGLGRPSNEGIEASLGVVSAVGGPVHTRHGAIDKYIRTERAWTLAELASHPRVLDAVEGIMPCVLSDAQVRWDKLKNGPDPLRLT